MKKLILGLVAVLSMAASAQSIEINLGPGYKCSVQDGNASGGYSDQFSLYLFDMVFAPVAVNPPGAARIILDNAVMWPTISLIDDQAMLQQGFAGLSISVEKEAFSGLIISGQSFSGSYQGMNLVGPCEWSANVIRTEQPY